MPMPELHRWLPGLALALVCASAANSETPEARVAHLLQLAAQSLTERDLTLARLRVSVAHRLDPVRVQDSPVARAVAQLDAQEDGCIRDSAVAVQARDAEAVRRAVACLRRLDRHSAAALEVVLRYQAAMADLGGAFPRVRWEAWRESASSNGDSPREPRTAASHPAQ